MIFTDAIKILNISNKYKIWSYLLKKISSALKYIFFKFYFKGMELILIFQSGCQSYSHHLCYKWHSRGGGKGAFHWSHLVTPSCCLNVVFFSGPSFQFISVQLLSRVWLFATPWIAARQVSLSITNSRSLPKLMSIESVMPSSHLTLCCPLLLLPPIPPSIRVFSNGSTLCMRWPKYWSFSFSISSSSEHPGLIFRMDWLDLLAVQGTLKK